MLTREHSLQRKSRTPIPLTTVVLELLPNRLHGLLQLVIPFLAQFEWLRNSCLSLESAKWTGRGRSINVFDAIKVKSHVAVISIIIGSHATRDWEKHRILLVTNRVLPVRVRLMLRTEFHTGVGQVLPDIPLDSQHYMRRTRRPCSRRGPLIRSHLTIPFIKAN